MPIDVIVPVYRGEAETRACLESVLSSQVRIPHEVTVIDDAGPEPALSAWLRELQASGRIHLIVHPANRGFVGTVNEAMALHPERDVVLLNSDTEVGEGWLDRLAAHAARDPEVGTVTPFSSNATICSYPRTLQSNPMPSGETTRSLDAAFAAANGGLNAPIPTAVGFCMYVTRRCLDAVGVFDEARYGAGYGEEVDFCMRAARAGFRHLVAADVFVRHVGEVSFGTTGTGRRANAQAVIDSLYPEFQQLLAAFFREEPLRELRRRADLERLRRSTRPRVLFVSHGFGGGVARHIDTLATALCDHAEVLMMQPHGGGFASLRWLRPGEEFQAWFHAERDWDHAVALLEGIGIDRVHYHHVHGWPPSILQLSQRLGCAHDVTLHDYFCACPAYHLTGGNGRYCGGAPDCGHCTDAKPAQWPLSIPAWRATFHEVLFSAARVIAPSHDAAARTSRFFPGIAPVVWPHPEEPAAPPGPIARVLVPGAISSAKGFDVLEACVRDAAARDLPLHFRVLGYTVRPIEPWPALPYSVAGEYGERDLPALIGLEGGDAIFFPAQCPETYSYTLTTALASGLPIIATNLGAFPERLAHHPAASIVPWDATPAAMNDAILERVTLGAARSTVAPLMSPAEYRARYLEGIARCREARGTPAVNRGWLEEPRVHRDPASLAALFEDAIRCGRGKSLVELERRTAEADLALAQAADERNRMHASLAEHEARVRELAAECEATLAERDRLAARAIAAEEWVRFVESSRSWRVTAPFRALARRVRRQR